MKNSSSWSPEQAEMLLRLAEKRLGLSPAMLAKAVQEGGLSAVSETLSPEKRQQLEAVLGDRRQVEQWLQSPEIAAWIQRMTGQS